MDSSGIPQDKISRLSADLDRLASSILEPLDFFWGESEPVGRAPGLSLRVMSPEEGLVECTRPLQDDETSVVGTVRGKVEYPLDTLHPFTVRTLVDVRPRGHWLSVFRWKGQIGTIE